MICLVRNIITNEAQAIHRTALAPDGTAIKRPDKAGRPKTFRMSLGTVSGGAIKLDPDENVTQGVCIGEGVETCLAGRQMGLRPVWSVVNTSGVAKFPLLPGVAGLHLFKENDPNGASAEAVETCARRWYGAGREVIIVEPDIGNDLNDELARRQGENDRLCAAGIRQAARHRIYALHLVRSRNTSEAPMALRKALYPQVSIDHDRGWRRRQIKPRPR